MLLRGLFEQAIACIERSEILTYLDTIAECSVSASIIRDIISLLGIYPRDSSTTFREWKSLALELVNNFANSDTNVSGELRDYIEDVLLVISGNQNKILHYSKTWYESYCGLMLYYIPSLELSQEYLTMSLKINPLDITNNWEKACADIINGNISSILPTLESLDTCTAAFTAAICEAKGLLENPNDILNNNDSDFSYGNESLFSPNNGMATYLINNFALELCSHDDRDLWPISIGLIAISPMINGNSNSIKKATISELLLHYPFKTNDDIEWMLSICAEWKLPEVAKTLYTILGNQMLYQGNTIEAITNFSKGGKFELVKQYSWMMFEASFNSTGRTIR